MTIYYLSEPEPPPSELISSAVHSCQVSFSRINGTDGSAWESGGGCRYQFPFESSLILSGLNFYTCLNRKYYLDVQ